MYPADRGRDFVLREPYLKTQRFLSLMTAQARLTQQRIKKSEQPLKQRYLTLQRLSLHREYQVFRTQTG